MTIHKKRRRSSSCTNKDDDMLDEYDFSGGVRGKYAKAMQAGYTVTIHQADGTTITKDVVPNKREKLLSELRQRK